MATTPRSSAAPRRSAVIVSWRSRTPAGSHHWVQGVEVMGRHTGWIALESGLAGGADVILIPEIPYSLDRILEKIQEREESRRRFSIIVVAEGAKPAVWRRPPWVYTFQRGGSPVPYDRILALRFGAAAVHAVERGNFGCMVALRGNDVRSVPLGDAVTEIKRVPEEGEVVRTARRLGVSFGD